MIEIIFFLFHMAMFPTWVDFYFLKTFKRHTTFAKICKRGVLKKVWEKGFSLAPTPSSSFIDLYREQCLLFYKITSEM